MKVPNTQKRKLSTFQSKVQQRFLAQHLHPSNTAHSATKVLTRRFQRTLVRQHPLGNTPKATETPKAVARCRTASHSWSSLVEVACYKNSSYMTVKLLTSPLQRILVRKKWFGNTFGTRRRHSSCHGLHVSFGHRTTWHGVHGCF